MSAVNQNKKSKVTSILSPPRQAKQNRSTGPVTPEGKRISSNNSTTHGCLSSFPIVNGQLTPEAEARIVLPDEDRAHWEALKQSWHNEYQPDTDVRLTLLLHAVVADWMVRRNARRYNDVEQLLYLAQPDATLWSAEQHAQLERFLRYLAEAERSFYRARNALEQLRREKKRDGERADALDEKSRRDKVHPESKAADAPPADAGENNAQRLPERAERALIQCITVQVIDGKTLTLFQPRNENLARIIITAGEPKPTVKRALYFLHGIPDEYAWVTDFDNHDGRPHFVLTRTSAEALDDLERERLEGGTHVLKVPR